jgi:membrane-bound metal-dependent hydrolase YbcI (DUF457 family)
MLSAALHLLAAALIGLLFALPAPIFLIGLLTALVPDLDTTRSLLGRLCNPLSHTIEAHYGHRSLTHSLLALGLASAIAWIAAPAFWLPLAFCYASHLLIDLCIGRHGIQLFWPNPSSYTFFGWRDDGPAPRRLLIFLVPLVLLTAFWSQIWPHLQPTAQTVAAIANPIATRPPTSTPYLTPTKQASIHLSFELPAHVSISSLRVKIGDSIAEGEILAAWEQPTLTPWPTPSPPLSQPSPASAQLAPPAPNDSSAQIAAQSALDALRAGQPAERASLLQQHQSQLLQAERAIQLAQEQLDLLQPMHLRAQAEAQTAVDIAHQRLLDAQSAASLFEPSPTMNVEAEQLRLSIAIHSAEAELRRAIDAQDRMRSEQGIERQLAEGKLSQAHTDLIALQQRHTVELQRLDAEHTAALLRAQGQLAAANAAANARAEGQNHQYRQLAATLEAGSSERYNAWALQATATQRAHAQAVRSTATSAALMPKPPDRIISRVHGKVVAISAKEQSGVLIVTLEVVP